MQPDDRDGFFFMGWFIFIAVMIVLVWCGLAWAVYELVQWVKTK